MYRLTGSQDFGYDRWGNRTITSATGTGINNKQFTVNDGKQPARSAIRTERHNDVRRCRKSDHGHIQRRGSNAGLWCRQPDGVRNSDQEALLPVLTPTTPTVNECVEKLVLLRLAGLRDRSRSRWRIRSRRSSNESAKEFGYRNGELLINSRTQRGK